MLTEVIPTFSKEILVRLFKRSTFFIFESEVSYVIKPIFEHQNIKIIIFVDFCVFWLLLSMNSESHCYVECFYIMLYFEDYYYKLRNLQQKVCKVQKSSRKQVSILDYFNYSLLKMFE